MKMRIIKRIIDQIQIYLGIIGLIIMIKEENCNPGGNIDIRIVKEIL